MRGKSIYKIPEGKLLKIFLEFEENKINKVKITGDFFLHPEEGVEKIENNLKGIEIKKEIIIEKVNEAVSSESIELFGITAEGITQGILMARESHD